MPQFQVSSEVSVSRKVFFALLPGESVLKKIVHLQGKIQGSKIRWIVPQNIHLTLCFVGNVDQPKLECIKTSVENIHFDKINLTLNLVGYFKRAGIFWLGSNQFNIALSELYNKIARKLEFCDVITKKQEFVPHITLARKVKRELLVPEFETIDWNSDRFCLMESIQVRDGVEYKLLKEYPSL